MNRLFKKFGLALAVVLFSAALGGCTIADSGRDEDKDVGSIDPPEEDYSKFAEELTIEGGGQNTAYNSTESLIYDKYSNPYPYNALEKLVAEWNEAHAKQYGYYFTVAKSAINNDRETMVPMLNQGTAPEIIYYLGTTIAEDQGKGWFYDLKEVMETPNRYSKQGEAGSVRWRDLYADDLYSTFFSPDGQMFTVNLEQNPIGMIYNKSILEAAGVTEPPETFRQFMEAQDKINAYAISQNRGDPSDDSKYIAPYFPYYPWYDSFLETSLLGEKLEYLDVIKTDGYVDAEEFVRGYLTKSPEGESIYSPESDVAVEMYRLIKLMCKYYPTNYSSYYADQQFTQGNIAFYEVLGGNIRQLVDLVDGKFEIGVMPFPILETRPSASETSEYYTDFNTQGYLVQRGLSGYSTGWGISNAAMNRDAKNGNSKCVDACIDMLMWLSCFENNDKMVNGLKFAIPLSGNTDFEYFKPLAEVFKKDRTNEKALAWASVSAGGAMNKDYYDAVYLFRTSVLSLSDSEIAAELKKRLTPSFQAAANTLYAQNNWNREAWPAYGATSGK